MQLLPSVTNSQLSSVYSLLQCVRISPIPHKLLACASERGENRFLWSLYCLHHKCNLEPPPALQTELLGNWPVTSSRSEDRTADKGRNKLATCSSNSVRFKRSYGYEVRNSFFGGGGNMSLVSNSILKDKSPTSIDKSPLRYCSFLIFQATALLKVSQGERNSISRRRASSLLTALRFQQHYLPSSNNSF